MLEYRMGKGELQERSPERQIESKWERPLDGSLQVMESHGGFWQGRDVRSGKES